MKPLAILVLMLPIAANADIIYSDSNGLVGAEFQEDFEGTGLASNATLTTQLSPLSFSGTNNSPFFDSCGTGFWDSSTHPGISGSYVNTFGPGCITNSVDSTFTMSFGSSVNEASIGFFSNSSTITEVFPSIDLLLGGSVVESVFLGNLDSGSSHTFSNNIFGDSGFLIFTNSTFDAIRWNNNLSRGEPDYFVMDNVSWNTTSVPEPGTLALLGIGLFGMGLARRRRD